MNLDLVRYFLNKDLEIALLSPYEEDYHFIQPSISASEGNCEIYFCPELTSDSIRENIQKIAAGWGNHLSALVNTSVSPDESDMISLSAEDLTAMFQNSVCNAIYAVQSALPFFEKNGGGSVVNIGSVSGDTGDSNCAGYSICSSAMGGITRAMAADCRSRNIRVNCVSIDPRPFSDRLDPNADIDPNIRDAVINSFPVERTINIEKEVAPVVYFLCSPESSAITSRTLIADGGYGGFR